MGRNVRAEADYPFTEANLEASVLEVDAFVAEPPLSALERGEVLEFVRLTRQYAFLERLIQGEVLYDLPVHIDLRPDRDPDPMRQAEALADEERELLGLGVEPAEGLLEALDERGIKVFRRAHGPESPEKLTGAFHYSGPLGPSVLVGAAEGNPEAAFILAHEYGHLVMDVDPYESRFCRWRRPDLANVSNAMAEARADRFARALLLPPDLVQAVATEVGIDATLRPGDLADRIARAALSFGVAPAVLWRRLSDLALPRGERPPAPFPPDEAREVDDLRPTDLPERFVNLALAAFGQRLLERSDLSRFLRIPPARLERFLAWCPIPRVPKPLGGTEEEPQ